jgi:hypothetical protein
MLKTLSSAPQAVVQTGKHLNPNLSVSNVPQSHQIVQVSPIHMKRDAA